MTFLFQASFEVPFIWSF